MYKRQSLFSVQITKSGFKTSKPEIDFPKSPAVTVVCPETLAVTCSAVAFSDLALSLNCFKFRIISVTSSITPGIVENSCSTPSTVSYTHLDVYKRQEMR